MQWNDLLSGLDADLNSQKLFFFNFAAFEGEHKHVASEVTQAGPRFPGMVFLSFDGSLVRLNMLCI